MANGSNLWNGMLSNLQQTQETKMTIIGASKKSLTMIYSTRNPKLCNNQKIYMFFGAMRVGPSNHDPMREMRRRPMSQGFMKSFLSLLKLQSTSLTNGSKTNQSCKDL